MFNLKYKAFQVAGAETKHKYGSSFKFDVSEVPDWAWKTTFTDKSGHTETQLSYSDNGDSDSFWVGRNKYYICLKPTYWVVLDPLTQKLWAFSDEQFKEIFE